MREVLETILSDFFGLEMPLLVKRDNPFPVLPGKATVVMGMRRTGKTYYCYQQIRSLLEAGVEKSRILYLNLDDERLLDFNVRDFQLLLDVYYSRWPENKSRLCYFFFDEIQMVDNWERFIRRLIDTENVQIAITGSSSKLLSTEIATSLRGRTLNCEVFPFSFREYLLATQVFTTIPKHPGSVETAKLRKAIGEYIKVGGFPETLGLNPTMRRNVLQSYVETVLFKDIVERHKVSNVLALRHIISAILNSPAQQFSVNKFYNTLKSKGVACTKNALYEYMDFLSDAYFAYRLPMHAESERVRQVNPEKVYSNDTAFHSCFMSPTVGSRGFLLETLVFLHLRRKQHDLSFVRTHDNREIDFLAVDPATSKVCLIQVCEDLSTPDTLARELKGLTSPSNALPSADRMIVTWDDSRDIGNGIKAIPIWKFLLS
jgi:hypothetical protein